MRTRLMTMAALVMTGALTLSAQTPQRPPDPQDTTQRKQDPQPPAAAANATAVTVTGCLKAEKDVPGRRPNAAEAVGVGDDYVLTNVQMSTASTTAAIGLAPMYEIEGIAEAELQKHLNHQVEIVGTITKGNLQGNRGASAAPGSAAAANADLPQLQATTLKMLAATCPAPK